MSVILARSCYACGSFESEKHKLKSGELRDTWLVNHGTPFVLCRACNNYYVRRPPKVRTHAYRASIKERRCSVCDLPDPNPNGNEKYWMRNKEESGKWLCIRCYAKKYLHPINNPRAYAFKNKKILHKTWPRIGVCNLCRAVVGIDCQRTSLHHEEYDETNTLSHTIEVCASCHAKITKTGESQTSTFRVCYICGDDNAKTVNEKKRWISTNDNTKRFFCTSCSKTYYRHNG